VTLDPRKRIRRSAGTGRSGDPAPDRAGRSTAASPDAAVAVSPRRPDGAVPGTGGTPGTVTSAAAGTAQPAGTAHPAGTVAEDGTVPPAGVVPAGGAVGGGAVGGGAVRGGAVGGGVGGRRSRRAVGALPYGLLVPSVLLLLGLLGYPMYVLVRTSFQQLDLRQLIHRQTVWTGFDNYRTILTDGEFWAVTVRTVVFAAVCVALTIGLGTLVALLMRRTGRSMRLLISAGLLLAWATPPVSAATVFKWLFDEQYGVVDWLVTKLTPLDWSQHSWFDSQLPAFSVIVLCVVWQSIPFVALTLYAGLTTVPDAVLEAARIDGAGAWRSFWSVTGPMLKPLYLILISLSVIWDLKVFTQVYVITRGGPDRKTLLINLYTYIEGFGASRFGLASAAAVVMVLITLAATVWYVRSMIRVGEEEL
jgi:N,N'-diacetylchitobiose transport system permease protein